MLVDSMIRLCTSQANAKEVTFYNLRQFIFYVIVTTNIQEISILSI